MTRSSLSQRLAAPGYGGLAAEGRYTGSGTEFTERPYNGKLHSRTPNHHADPHGGDLRNETGEQNEEFCSDELPLNYAIIDDYYEPNWLSVLASHSAKGRVIQCGLIKGLLAFRRSALCLRIICS